MFIRKIPVQLLLPLFSASLLPLTHMACGRAVAVPGLGAAAIKGETLRLSLNLAWRADLGRPPIDTGSGMISGPAGEGVMRRVAQTRQCPRLRRSVPPYQGAQGANGSDCGAAQCAIKALLKSINDDVTERDRGNWVDTRGCEDLWNWTRTDKASYSIIAAYRPRQGSVQSVGAKV